ncbi:hypothetical protein F383_38884 [Gossypium arboreum]|uniref:Uncharacterized protein n=1 Tax=Gossypium arboreum TaxID=29729 RepID=A0A0B0MLL7_GOSAR|nr:hypothetical protein F383_38884 [Gossypium arboreum]
MRTLELIELSLSWLMGGLHGSLAVGMALMYMHSVYLIIFRVFKG